MEGRRGGADPVRAAGWEGQRGRRSQEALVEPLGHLDAL